MDIALVTCRAVGTWPIAPTPEDPFPWAIDDRPLHAALVARGARVHVPAWDDPDVDWSRFDLAVTRSTWDYHHRRDAFVAWAARVPRLAPSAEVVRWNTDKRYLRDLAVPQVPTIWLEPGQALPDVPWPRAFLKPVVGATAEHTLRFTDPDLARAHLAEHPTKAWMLQPYVADVETMGERSAIVVGGQVTHYVRKDPVPGDYRVQDDYGATDRPHEPTALEQRFVADVIAAMPRLAYARIDWLPTEAGPALIELELVEPCLFFRHGPGAAEKLAERLLSDAGSTSDGRPSVGHRPT